MKVEVANAKQFGQQFVITIQTWWTLPSLPWADFVQVSLKRFWVLSGFVSCYHCMLTCGGSFPRGGLVFASLVWHCQVSVGVILAEEYVFNAFFLC